MRVLGYQLFPVQTGGSILGSRANPTPIQQQIYSNLVANPLDTIANNTGPLGFASNFDLVPGSQYAKGGTFRTRWRGIVSCTGTPTLRLQVYWTNGGQSLSDSHTYTMPSGISNAEWQVDAAEAIDESGNIGDCGSVFYMPVSVSPFVTTPILGIQGFTTFSGTGPIGLQVTWSAADPANTISLQQAYMDYYPPGVHS